MDNQELQIWCVNDGKRHKAAEHHSGEHLADGVPEALLQPLGLYPVVVVYGVEMAYYPVQELGVLACLVPEGNGVYENYQT